MNDVILDGLRQLHDQALEAGRLYVAGDVAAALAELSDLRILAGEVIADLEREHDPEPAA